MTKSEFKNLKHRINKKSKEIDVETKALQRAIDRNMGDTAMIKRKLTELKELLSELKDVSH